MNEQRYVITIGRQFGSQGKAIGQQLARQLGISFYDKELLSLASQESGLCPEFFEKADEKSTGSLWHSFVTGFPYGGIQYNDYLSNERLFQIQSDVIRKLAEEESFVIVGRCADYILRDNPRCLSLFLHAPRATRIRTVMHREHLPEAEAADLIRRMDKTRANYYNYYTDKIWGDAASYHASLDTSLLGEEKTIDFIRQLIRGGILKERF